MLSAHLLSSMHSTMYSHTRRIRAYWHSHTLPKGYDKAQRGHKDPNLQMNPGRKVQKQPSSKGLYCIPIGSSWSGDANAPVANTNARVMVIDEMHDDPQELLPEEIERLHGIYPGTTSGHGITAIQRHKALGNGWDINVTSMLIAPMPLRGCITPIFNLEDAANAKIQSLQQNATAEQEEQCQMLLSFQEADPESFNKLALEVSESQGDIAAAAMVGMAEYARRQINILSNRDTIIVDSGAGTHVDPDIIVTDSDNVTKLHGFTGEPIWTQGNGYLPLNVNDELSGDNFDLDIQDAEKVKQSTSALLSLGKLTKEGWRFELSNDECCGYTPTGQKVKLQSDRHS